eukprot:Opistho-2@64598
MEQDRKRLRLSIEPLIDRKIREIDANGEEKFDERLKPSERLFRTVQRIDFGDVVKAFVSEEDAAAGQQRDAPGHRQDGGHQPQDHLKNALDHLIHARSELDVTVDLLSLLTRKKYMRLEQIGAAGPPAHNLMVPLLSKGKDIATATAALLERSAAMSETISGESRFYRDLLALKRRWNLRLVNGAAFLDLGYQRAGSSFPEKSEADIGRRKADAEPVRVTVSDDISNGRVISVRINFSPHSQPSRNGDSAHMRPSRRTADETAVGFGSTLPLDGDVVLSRAREALFCKELFGQLGKEAFAATGANASIAGGHATVLDNRVVVSFDSGASLEISIESPTSTKTEKDKDSADARMKHAAISPIEAAMELRLHTLLRKHHAHIEAQRHGGSVYGEVANRTSGAKAGAAPPSAVGGLPSGAKSSAAPPRILARTAEAFNECAMRFRLECDLDALASIIRDPHIRVHWSTSTAFDGGVISRARIVIGAEGGRAGRSIVLTLNGDGVEALSENGRPLHLSADDVVPFVMVTCARCLCESASEIARSLMWRPEPSDRLIPMDAGCALSLRSRDGKRRVSIAWDVVVGTKQVRCSMMQLDAGRLGHVSLSGGVYRPVQWDALPGRDSGEKLRYLLLVGAPADSAH